MKFIFLFIVLSVLCGAFASPSSEDDTPYPFTRVLEYNSNNPMNGTDVYIAQHLLNRWALKPNLNVTRVYDAATAKAVEAYKAYRNLDASNSRLTKEAAKALLEEFTHDRFVYDGKSAAQYGKELGLDLKYLIYIPVYNNRSVETYAELRDKDNRFLMKFVARTHGHTVPGEEEWPAFDNTVGLSQFVGNGNTPTGVALMDFNTREPESVEHLYGPYEVNRFVRGIEGNAKIILPHVRNGILLHTGGWSKAGWQPPKPMPNSSGCVHSWPEDVKKIAEILKSLGVKANENPFGKLPYPYTPQGIVVVENVDRKN